MLPLPLPGGGGRTGITGMLVLFGKGGGLALPWEVVAPDAPLEAPLEAPASILAGRGSRAGREGGRRGSPPFTICLKKNVYTLRMFLLSLPLPPLQKARKSLKPCS